MTYGVIFCVHFQVEQIPSERNAELLSIVETRGPHAFNNFTRALRECGMEFIAQKLEEEAQGT